MERARQLDVDVAWVVGSMPFHASAYTLDDRGVEDAFRFAVALRPFTTGRVVETHYAILSVTSHETTGRVLYLDPQASPLPMKRARPIVIADHERDAARRRVAERAAEYARVCRLEEEALRRAELEQKLRRRNDGGAAIVASLQSGEFEVLEIVPDPFPQPRPVPARLLVIDSDDRTADALADAPELKVFTATDVWTALDMMNREHLDLVIAARRVAGISAADLMRMSARIRPELANRFALLVAPHEIHEASAALRRRALLRPLDIAAVRALIAAQTRTAP